MITKLGEVFGGVSGGKRGILSSKGFLSLPLRFTFCAYFYYPVLILPKASNLLYKSIGCITSLVKPFQVIAR